jgi:hypothetical protein
MVILKFAKMPCRWLSLTWQTRQGRDGRLQGTEYVNAWLGPETLVRFCPIYDSFWQTVAWRDATLCHVL